METPALSIKIKGADAINALVNKGQILGTVKLEGGAALAKGGVKAGAAKAAAKAGAAKAGAAKAGAAKATELEVERIIAMKNGIVKYEMEGLAKAGVVTKGAAAKAGTAAKIATGKGAASAGTIWSGKGLSLGLGWGLGAMGPILVLGALGLGAVGVYLYRRNRKLEEDEMAFEDELPAL